MALNVPERIAANCRKSSERAAWLNGLPGALRDLERRWSLVLGAPVNEETSCAWAAPATCAH